MPVPTGRRREKRLETILRRSAPVKGLAASTRAASGWSVAEAGEALWHDIECGAYDADLPLWRELATAACRDRHRGCRVLELGAGTGRVALALAADGHQVTGIDFASDLVDVLERRASEQNVPVVTRLEDARSFRLREPFDLVLAPMQLVQLLHEREQRLSMLRCVLEHLYPGSRAAVALLDASEQWDVAEDAKPPVPDILEAGGWVYSSQPLAVRRSGGMLELDRLRQVVSPAGALRKRFARIRLVLLEPEEVEDEARECGLLPDGRRAIPPTREHVGSTVVVLRRPGPDEPAPARDA
jgi:SAM-dependent methyltransferase